MPIRKRTNAIEREGVAYIRSVIEKANCVFLEVDRAGDYGHDAFVLIVDGEEVTAKQIALQIKSGSSYNAEGVCKFEATLPQLNFWAAHDLTTLGVVYDPILCAAWWIDLKDESAALKRDGGRTIKFEKAQWNKFDLVSFTEILVPRLQGRIPRLSLEKALEWSHHNDENDRYVGIKTLLTKHISERQTWDRLFEIFENEWDSDFGEIEIAFFRVMDHNEDCYRSGLISEDLKREIQNKILSFGVTEVAKLLDFDGQGFDRGDFGYGLFAIVPRLQDWRTILQIIIGNEKQAKHIRENAKILIAIEAHDPHWWSLWVPREDWRQGVNNT